MQGELTFREPLFPQWFLMARVLRAWVLRACLIAVFSLSAADIRAGTPPARFPRPEFEAEYVQPKTDVPPPRTIPREYVDVAVLAASLALASRLAIKGRSRRAMVLLSVFSIAYFGFYRRGCVCPVGAIQNVAAALADPAQVIPWTVAAFFLLPLVATALFGRTFCGGVCPLGALQELVVWKPLRVPAWLNGLLRLLPPLYLGLAVLLAATGADYIICRYDPFIGFYRLGGPMAMLTAGAVLLIGGMFVGRMYCRYLCPYGVLLGWISCFAWRHATITPEGCINCRLCENACPYDCIRAPEQERSSESPQAARRRLGLTLAVLPLLLLLGTGIGFLMHVPLSRLHADVRLAERVAWEERQGDARTFTIASEAFRSTGRPLPELYSEAAGIRRKFRAGSVLLGGFMGLMLGARLIGLSRWPRQGCHDMDHSQCVSCARCFAHCSVERDRLARPASTPDPGGTGRADR
jgi:ferredoxin